MAYIPLAQEFAAKYVIIGGPRELSGLGRQNLVPNPSFEVNATGWSQYDDPNTQSTTFESQTGWAKSGARSLRYVATRLNSQGYLGPVMLAVPALPNTVYSFGLEMNKLVVPASASSFIVYIEFFNSGGGYVGATGLNTVSTALGETSFSHVGAPSPATTAMMRIIVLAANVVAGQTLDLRLDSVKIAPESAVTAYFDGDKTGYAWTGTAHNSRSVQDGTRAVLNDAADPDYVGTLTEITGLDSAEIRESAEDLVESDGGSHGSFYFGRRPITMNVKVHGHPTTLDRATRIDRLRRATTALRSDADLLWAPLNHLTEGLQIPVRRQQPFREVGGWNKDLQVALVSEKAVIESQTQRQSPSTTSSVTIENKGSYPAYPQFEISGTSVSPSVASSNGGAVFTSPSGATLSLDASEKVVIDTLTHSATFTAGARSGQSANKYINFATTAIWPYLDPAGETTFTLSGGGSLIVKWRDAWA